MHAYPENLAAVVRAQWDQPATEEDLATATAVDQPDPLPPSPVLEQLLSTCFQASLLREEQRWVRFRLILREPERFDALEGPPIGLHRLVLSPSFPCEPNELRRLSPAAAYERALIGIRLGPQNQPVIWGILHTGEGWIRALEGARGSSVPLPASLVVQVTGSGQLTVCQGSRVIARLLTGRVAVPHLSTAQIPGPTAEAAAADRQFMRLHERARAQQGRSWAKLDPGLLHRIRFQAGIRLVSAMRNTRHGGTLLVLPRDLARRASTLKRYLSIKYAFPVGESRLRFQTVTLQLLNALAADSGRRFGPGHVASWQDFLTSTDPAVLTADQALTELAQLTACMTAVDGAVVMARPAELLGFGAEISGRLPPVEYVARAADPVGAHMEIEPAMSVGTRHRSAYRFVNVVPNAVALVVSQDGAVRVILKIGDRVQYSDYLSGEHLGI